MKITVINSSPRRGNSYTAKELFKNELKKYEDIEFNEFYLPRDFSSFCKGCYKCYDISEEKCPDYENVKPILNSILESDGIVITTPVYVMGMSAQLKAFLDHLGYIYMPHRPRVEMFSKVALIISTTTGAGLSNVRKAVTENLKFYGVRKVSFAGFRMGCKNWQDMPEKRQDKYRTMITKKAKEFHNDLGNRHKLPVKLWTKMIFFAMKMMIRKYDENNIDKIYWREKGWLTGKEKPY